MTETIDAEHLLSLARDGAGQAHAELALVIEDLFENRASVLSDREKHLMFNIIKNLVHEVEVSVKKKLSEKLATQPDVPHDLVMQLASDEFDVAYPILTKSKAIRDEDLIEIIRLRTEEYHLAISLRDDLIENVTDVLVEVGSDDVVESLLNNKNAKISHATIEFLVEQSKRVDTFQEPLIHRQELTETLAKKMFTWVSDALRQNIVGRYELDDETVSKLLEQAETEEFSSLSPDQNGRPDGSSELLESMKHEGMVTHQMLIDVISRGEIALFIAMFCEMTQLDELLAKKILFEESGENMAIACRAIEISDINFSIIYSKTRRVAPNRPRATREDINKMFDLYQDVDVEHARRTLKKWQNVSITGPQ